MSRGKRKVGISDAETEMEKNELIHIRVGRQLRRDIEKLIKKGIFSSQTELAREAIRNLILKYRQHYAETLSQLESQEGESQTKDEERELEENGSGKTTPKKSVLRHKITKTR